MTETSSYSFQRENNDIQLSIDVSMEDHYKLVWMASLLEASSLGEVVRRALMALEDFEPVFSENPSKRWNEKQTLKRLHVRVSKRTKERLESLKEQTGLSTSKTLSDALSVLAQLVRRRAKMHEYNSNENNNSNEDECILAERGENVIFADEYRQKKAELSSVSYNNDARILYSIV